MPLRSLPALKFYGLLFHKCHLVLSFPLDSHCNIVQTFFTSCLEYCKLVEWLPPQNTHVHLELRNLSLFGNRVFVDVIS